MHRLCITNLQTCLLSTMWRATACSLAGSRGSKSSSKATASGSMADSYTGNQNTSQVSKYRNILQVRNASFTDSAFLLQQQKLQQLDLLTVRTFCPIHSFVANAIFSLTTCMPTTLFCGLASCADTQYMQRHDRPFLVSVEVTTFLRTVVDLCACFACFACQEYESRPQLRLKLLAELQ